MKISNKYLKATLNAKGAELASLVHIGSAREYIWQAHPKHWGRHAPVLFPFVGKLSRDRYTHEGHTYPMERHGFARDMEFDIIAHTSDQITFLLEHSSETLKKYPFRFQLRITYSLDKAALKTTYEVANRGKATMYFSIGGHPAFNCPMSPDESRSEYWLEFSQQEPLDAHLLDGDLFSGKTETMPVQNRRLAISDQMFDNDALVFKNLASESITLASPKQAWLTFHFEGYPYLGIWSKGRESPFVCIEPWHGLADSQQHNGQLAGKEGIKALGPSEVFSCSYTIEVL